MDHFFFTEPAEYEKSVVASKWNATAKSNLDKLKDELNNWLDFTAASIDKLLHEFMANRSIKAGDLLPLLRVMLIGSKNGPAVYEIISLLGKRKKYFKDEKSDGAL
jgi:glutamyl-tRNA synthetase